MCVCVDRGAGGMGGRGGGGGGGMGGQRFALGLRPGTVCHKCGKEGHVVRFCPTLNNPDFRKEPVRVSSRERFGT